jgi:hypothetical protein
MSVPAFGTDTFDNDFFEIRYLARHRIIATVGIRWYWIHLTARYLFGKNAHFNLLVVGFSLL